MKAKHKVTGEIIEYTLIPNNDYQIVGTRNVYSSSVFKMEYEPIEDTTISDIWDKPSQSYKEAVMPIKSGNDTWKDRFNAENNWQEEIENTIEKIVDCFEGKFSYHAGIIRTELTYLLEKQREEIQFKLNKHWDKLETNDYDLKDMDNWRIFKCIRNNNNDVINDNTQT